MRPASLETIPTTRRCVDQVESGDELVGSLEDEHHAATLSSTAPDVRTVRCRDPGQPVESEDDTVQVSAGGSRVDSKLRPQFFELAVDKQAQRKDVPLPPARR